jgi:hypothetical protein
MTMWRGAMHNENHKVNEEGSTQHHNQLLTNKNISQVETRQSHQHSEKPSFLTMAQMLPEDILYLLCDELLERRDFGTL